MIHYIKQAWDWVRGVTKEREACAMVAEGWADFYPASVFPPGGESVDCQSADMMRHASAAIAADIRARAQQEEEA